MAVKLLIGLGLAAVGCGANQDQITEVTRIDRAASCVSFGAKSDDRKLKDEINGLKRIKGTEFVVGVINAYRMIVSNLPVLFYKEYSTVQSKCALHTTVSKLNGVVLGYFATDEPIVQESDACEVKQTHYLADGSVGMTRTTQVNPCSLAEVWRGDNPHRVEFRPANQRDVQEFYRRFDAPSTLFLRIDKAADCFGEMITVKNKFFDHDFLGNVERFWHVLENPSTAFYDRDNSSTLFYERLPENSQGLKKCSLHTEVSGLKFVFWKGRYTEPRIPPNAPAAINHWRECAVKQTYYLPDGSEGFTSVGESIRCCAKQLANLVPSGSGMIYHVKNFGLRDQLRRSLRKSLSKARAAGSKIPGFG